MNGGGKTKQPKAAKPQISNSFSGFVEEETYE
jgi:hypothetical protein